VTQRTVVFTNGVDEASLVYTAHPNADASDLEASLYRDCCGIPAIQTANNIGTDGGTTRAMVDASGQPGNWHGEDTIVDDFSTTTNGIAPVANAPGSFTLDPCAIALFACDFPAGEHLAWRFGDGDQKEITDGTHGVQTHVYPTFSTSQQYLGELLLLGPNCTDDVTTRVCNLEDKAFFKVTN
jgi:hypothetical protein